MRFPWQLTAVLLLCACAEQHPAPSPGPLQQLQQARTLVLTRRYVEADAILRPVVVPAALGTLDPTVQHTALQLAAEMALEVHDPQRALSLLRRACDMPQTDSLDWQLRVRAAIGARDPADLAATITLLARRWPAALPQIQDRRLRAAVQALEDVGSDADCYDVLYALRRTDFKTEPDAASTWWRDLALLQLSRNEPAAAVQTLARVSDPYVAISVEADKRFDPISEDIASVLSVERAARHAMERALQHSLDDPGKLKPRNQLAHLLVEAQRFPQALQVTEAAIERKESQGGDLWSDYDHEWVWTLDYRATALWGLGRWDAAAAQMEAASALPQDGSENVSQVINLAAMYAKLERPEQSLATLRRLRPGSTSPAGEMQVQKLRLLAALQLHDEQTAAVALQFLSEHRSDALAAYQEALLVADRQEEGAQLLISRLEGARLRSDALVSVQEYAEPAEPPQVLEKHRRWRALVARADVQEALQRVGHAQHYPLDRLGY